MPSCVHDISPCGYCTPATPNTALARAAVRRIFAPVRAVPKAQQPATIVPVPSTGDFPPGLYERRFNPASQQLPRVNAPHYDVLAVGRPRRPR